MKDLETDDEEYRDNAIEAAREALRKARKLDARSEELEGAIIGLGKTMKHMCEDLDARVQEIAGLESKVEETAPSAAALRGLVAMVYDVERRLITPRELVQYVKDTFEEDGESK